MRSVFRVSFWREWLAVSICGQLLLTVVAACLLVYVIAIEEIMLWKGAMALWCIGSVVTHLLTAVKAWDNVRKYPVAIGPAAIDAFDWLGYPVAIGWDGVKSVRRRWYWTLYLTITSQAHQNVIWLPLNLVNFPEFVETVAEYAGSDHPLTVALYAEGDFD